MNTLRLTSKRKEPFRYLSNIEIRETADFVCCKIKSKYGIIQKKKSQLTFWNALGSSPRKTKTKMRNGLTSRLGY